jgi:hypothetical protein
MGGLEGPTHDSSHLRNTVAAQTPALTDRALTDRAMMDRAMMDGAMIVGGWFLHLCATNDKTKAG